MMGNERRQISERAPFETLILRMRGRLYQRAYQALHNAADAEDIAQEAMVRAWSRLDTFRPDPARDTEQVLGAWLHRITLNVLWDFLRRRRGHSTLSLNAMLEVNGEGDVLWPEFADRSQDPAERLLKREWSGRLHQALERLTPDHRACLLLLHQERSYQEIGALLNCPLGTVRSRIHRARVSLRQALQAEAE